VIAGETRRVGDRRFLDSDARVTSVTASSNARITRDGKAVPVDAIRVGDWVLMTLGPDGTAQTLDVMTKMKSRAPASGGTAWVRATARIGPLLVKAFSKTAAATIRARGTAASKSSAESRRCSAAPPLASRAGQGHVRGGLAAPRAMGAN
jgi:hypothetical protein